MFWSDGPDIRVTGFKLKEATAEAVYERGGGETDDGFVCKFRDLKWVYINWSDEQFCDGTETCSNKMDEPKGCQRPVIVTGSNGRDGINIKVGTSTYSQDGGSNIIYNEDNRWVIAEGSNPSDAAVMSEESSELLLARGWRDDQGKESNLQIAELPNNLDNNTL